MTFRLREHLKRHQIVRHHAWRAEQDEGKAIKEEALVLDDGHEGNMADEMEEVVITQPAESSISAQERESLPIIREASPPHRLLAADIQGGIYCKMCSMQFDNNEQLIMHEQWHESKGDILLCPHCPREFRRIDNLSRHLVTHKERSEFVCGDCGRTFGRRDNLARHQRSACRSMQLAAGQQSQPVISDVY